MLEFVRHFSQLHLLANGVVTTRSPTLKDEDPSDTTFNVVRAIKSQFTAGPDAQKFLQIDADLEELLTYLEQPPSKREQRSIVRELEARGLSAEQIITLLPRLTKRVQGHPVTMRLDAVRAAEMFDAGRTWGEIAREIPPKDPSDRLRNSDRIRKAVKSLDKLFRKFGISIPARRSRK
jgi:hypothetical protein